MCALYINTRIQQTAEKIAGFEELPEGWHYGSGSRPSHKTIQKALEINAELDASGFSKTNAFPGIEGEIQTTAYHGSLYLEFTIGPDGKITYAFEYNNNEIKYRSGLELDESIEIIRSFRGLLWVFSASFIKSTTTPIKEISRALPLNLRVMEVEYQQLMKNVFPKAESASAITLVNSTKTFWASRPSFGKSQPIDFLTITGSFNAPVRQVMPATSI